MAYQIGVRDENARSVIVSLEDANRLAGLDQKGLVVFQLAQRIDDGVEALPITGGLTRTTVDDQVLRPLRNLFVEVVVEHAQRCLLLPALAGDLVAAGCLER